jgi:hypothetical protein
MSTAAQISANIANAQSSCGPRSEAGKAVSSKNSVVFGLYSGDFIRPGEESVHATLNAALRQETTPVGVLEDNLVEEIRRAMWRLRRCGAVEAHMAIGLDNGSGYIFDPMETANAGAEKVQKSVDRARSQAHRLLHKCTAELRNLQTARRTESGNCELPPQRETAGSSPAALSLTKQTQPLSPETLRNAACPCGSGQKHKRCCGKSRSLASPSHTYSDETSPAMPQAA